MKILVCISHVPDTTSKINFTNGIKLTFNWYNKNRTYYKNLSKKDIIKRLGKV